LGRASGELVKLEQELETVCPLPERQVVKEILKKWRDPVALAGGVVGEEVLREPVNNPYTGFGGQPVEGAAFTGRSEILAQIETIWTNPGALPPLFLYGHRRMGKSSILRNLNLRRDPKTVLVLLDMQYSGGVDNTEQFHYEIALEIFKKARLVGWLERQDAPIETAYSSPGLARRALNSLFSRLEEKRDEQRIILVIDEFELIEKRIEEGRIQPDILEYLRSLTQRFNWLALIFGGLLTIEEMGRDYQNAFYGSSQNIRVSYLSRAETEKLICQPDPEFLLEYEPDLIDELYHLTNGQPFLLQRLCWELVNKWNERFLAGGTATERVLKLADLAALLTDDFYEAADNYFSGVWRQVGQAIMAALARTSEEGLTLAELNQALPELENISDAVKKLQRRDVADFDAVSGRLRFLADLNRHWVARNKQSR
jgi:hypothetical protein